MEIKSLIAQYGINYKKGYIGFTFYDNSFISKDIAYFTRWSRMSDIKVSHALIVTGDNECVEALMDKGVVSDKLTKYFEAPHTHIFFRKPRCYTDDIGDRIAASATTQVGLQYDKLLILAETMQGCFLGRWVRAVFGDKPDTFVSQMLNAKDKWICSELAAYSLDSQPEYQDKGILAKPDFTIDPQELFEDNTIFCDWHKT